MPRVYITRQSEQNNKLVMLIYGKMRLQRITQRVMASKLGISQPAFAAKLKKAQFTFADLITIFETLDMRDEEILSVMKMKV